MPLPRPAPGMVVRYAYLWRYEQRKGLEQGRKDRPCAIVLTTTTTGGELVVTVAPITHTAPADMTIAVALPAKVKRHLRLDDEPSWILADEVNRFVWPGPDLRPISRKSSEQFHYGFLPEDIFRELQHKIAAIYRLGRLNVAARSN